MIETLNTEYDKNYARWHDDKSIYDTNYEESTSSSCTYKENKVLVIISLTDKITVYIYLLST